MQRGFLKSAVMDADDPNPVVLEFGLEHGIVADVGGEHQVERSGDFVEHVDCLTLGERENQLPAVSVVVFDSHEGIVADFTFS